MTRYVGNNPIKYIDPIGLWAEDVHAGIGNDKYGTYTWAKNVGFSPSASRLIAIWNNATDWQGGKGWYPGIGDQSRHFNESGKCDSRDEWAKKEFQLAVQEAHKGKCKMALGHLGQGLHSLQDKYAHRNWNTGPFGSGKHSEWYDMWTDPGNREAAIATTNASEFYLTSFWKMNLCR